MNADAESPPALTPVASASSASSSESSDPSSTARSSVKRVSFCPLALLIGVAGEGEVEQAMVQAAQQQMGKRKVAVRTYSIEAPNLGEVAGKAWHSVVNGFTSSLEPFLHPGGGPAAGVCSASRARDSSPERERDLALSVSRSSSRSRSPSPGGRGRSTESAFQQDDPTFIPNSPTRLKLKIPTLRRECSNPGGTSPCGRPILRRPSVTSPSTASPPLPPLPDSSAPESTTTASSTASSSSAPPPRLYPTLSRTPSRPSPSPLHPTAGLIVPLQPCCQRCEAATVYGSSASSTSSGKNAGYKEHWSAGAKKQREDEQARRLEREGWAEDARKIAARYGYQGGEGLRKSETLEEKEAREVEEMARGSRLGRIAERGDVDDLADKRKHSSHAIEDVGASSTVDVEEGDEMEEVEVLGVVEPAGEQGLLATVISEEPASMELDAVDLPSSADFDLPSSSASPTATSSSLSTSQSPRPVPPSKVPTSINSSPQSTSSSSSPSRPAKRRLSSTSSAAKPSSPCAPPPARKHSLSFSQRLTSLGASFLQGANAGMGGAGGGAVRAG